jgi:ABC-type antimicrobial peptide transport system permease subunit
MISASLFRFSDGVGLVCSAVTIPAVVSHRTFLDSQKNHSLSSLKRPHELGEIARLTGFFGVSAVLLACVGVYGVMAFAISQRTHEIGIRMALGASRRDVLSLVLRETLVLAAVGIAAGSLSAVGATRLISSLLFGLKPGDPVTIFASALFMVAALVLAGIVPARRASKVDPMVALRYE